MNIKDLIKNVEKWNINERAKNEIKTLICNLDEERKRENDNMQIIILTHKLHGFIRALWYNNNITQVQYNSLYEFIFGF